MRRSERRRRHAATDASLLLVQDALVQIRTMAQLRRSRPAGKGEASGGGLINEYKQGGVGVATSHAEGECKTQVPNPSFRAPIR